MDSILKLENVSLTLNNKEILKNINFEIFKNENLVILGKNGSGKSFLLKIISTNIYHSTGKIKILGEDYGNFNVWELRKKIGYVSELLQNEYDKKTTVLNTIISGFFSSNGLFYEANKEMVNKAKELLDFFDIYFLKDRLFGELSHGEQKRVIIARSLVFKPKLLILDESCNGLDISSRETLLAYIEKLTKQDYNIIFATHNIDEIIEPFNKSLFLKKTEILLKGKTEQLLNSENISDLFDLNLKINKKGKRYFFEF